MDGQKLNEAIENTVRPKKEELAFLSNYVVNFAITDLWTCFCANKVKKIIMYDIFSFWP